MDKDSREPLKYLNFIPRDAWGAAEAKFDKLKVLNLPVSNVVTSWTETDPCTTRAECIKIVKAIQKDHMETRGLPDIEFKQVFS